MDIDLSKIQSLVDRPSESLAVELKRWIKPDSSVGKAKIARAVLALRNFNGGYLVIGFDDKTLKPDTENVPDDVRAEFHIDKIQKIIGRFASEPFEISIVFPERDGQIYPVLVIPSGVITPVAAKSDMELDTDKQEKKKLISTGDIYIRSLRSNNTPSTCPAQWGDWPNIMNICFDNREADIGRFLRRHMSSVTPEIIRELATTVVTELGSKLTKEELLHDYLKDSKERYAKVVKERGYDFPKHGSWEVALIISGDVPTHSVNQDFINLLNSSNPQYSGWPIWADTRRFGPEDQPYVYESTWEAFIDHHVDSWFRGIDFIRLDPRGKFYQYRALEDDFADTKHGPEPLTVLDFGIPIYRTAESIAVGLAFSKAMGCGLSSTTLLFAFRWSGLSGRVLSSWAQRGWMGGPPQKEAYQDELSNFISFPLDIPLSAISEYVYQGVKPLFEIFNGFTLGKSTVEEITRRCIERSGPFG